MITRRLFLRRSTSSAVLLIILQLGLGAWEQNAAVEQPKRLCRPASESAHSLPTKVYRIFELACLEDARFEEELGEIDIVKTSLVCSEGALVCPPNAQSLSGCIKKVSTEDEHVYFEYVCKPKTRLKKIPKSINTEDERNHPNMNKKSQYMPPPNPYAAKASVLDCQTQQISVHLSKSHYKQLDVSELSVHAPNHKISTVSCVSKHSNSTHVTINIFKPLACLKTDQVLSFFVLIKANNHTSNIYLDPIEKIHFTCNFDHDISETTKLKVEMPIKETSVENNFEMAIKIYFFDKNFESRITQPDYHLSQDVYFAIKLVNEVHNRKLFIRSFRASLQGSAKDSIVLINNDQPVNGVTKVHQDSTQFMGTFKMFMFNSDENQFDHQETVDNGYNDKISSETTYFDQKIVFTCHADLVPTT